MSKSPYKMVVGFDFSEQSEAALAAALEGAERHENSVLHVVSVLDDHHGLDRVVGQKVHYEDAQKLQDELSERVKILVERHQPEGLVFFVHARIGKPANEILGLAGEAGADIIFVGTRGRGAVQRFLLGSVAERVVRNASCTVQVVRPREYEEVAVPAVEPPCDKCVARRKESGGAEWWCEEHNQPYVQPHRYSYRSGITPIRTKDSVLW
jgi:nucleotide-binding universal stress UspA family protein